MFVACTNEISQSCLYFHKVIYSVRPMKVTETICQKRLGWNKNYFVEGLFRLVSSEDILRKTAHSSDSLK